MAQTDYATLAELKERVSLGEADTSEDLFLSQLLNAAAQWVDQRTRGYMPGHPAFSASASEARYYDDDLSGVIRLDDCLTVTEVVRNGAVYVSTQYTLAPYNVLPYTTLTFSPSGMGVLAGSGWLKGVKVTGTWGYCALADRPPIVKELTLSAAADLKAFTGLSMDAVLQASQISNPSTMISKRTQLLLATSGLVRERFIV